MESSVLVNGRDVIGWTGEERRRRWGVVVVGCNVGLVEPKNY